LYNDVVVAAKAKIEILRAIEAKKAQGSVLEYGIRWHLERFVSAVIVVTQITSNTVSSKEAFPTIPDSLNVETNLLKIKPKNKDSLYSG
jgi:gamma-glutamyl-gamma-aminobutyrate hydrolase PuuD